jgi:tetratricopeptide (TPR) repeat protein/energy-coupling factor transporter ATP-binding protein EcfA2
MPTPSFSWLHLTDFHFGLDGQNFLWPNLRQPFLDDLAELHKLTGPWQVVLFTGDLVQQGKPDEFKAMQQDVLGRLWEKLAELGSGNAMLLAVPGNHDLCRPNPKDDDPAVDKLLENDSFNDIAAKFWSKPDGSYRAVIDNAFAAYTDWWNAAPHRPKDLTRGELPGDFACTLECGDQRIGIVGLNTAFLQLQGSDYKGKLVWNTQQLQAVCGGAADDWSQRHSLCLLLTHQGPDWLTPEARKHGESEIAPAGRFALHLFGHMHEAGIQTTRAGGNPNATWLCKGASVFGMEKFGDVDKLVRSHGYSAGKIEFEQDHANLRIWPRIATNKTGPWRFIPDHEHAHLDSDQGTAAETLPLCVLKTPPPAAHGPEAVTLPLPPEPAKRTLKLYGRETLMQDAEYKLSCHPFLLVYGMRGNGKTELVKALAEKVPLQGKEFARIVLDPTTTPNYLFRQVASLLGETAELPKPPQGDAAAIAAEIRRRYPNPRSAWIWLDHAHHLLDASGFRSAGMRELLVGLQAALGMQWHWLLELRERPPQGLLGGLAASCEVFGLDKRSLHDCLADAAPDAREAEWNYSGDKLTQIFQWLGGGHGGRAHPQAIQLLIEVARGRNESPHEVLERHRGDLEKKIEDNLMGDLYSNVLSAAEQHLIKALALYRTVIPHDHLEKLEQSLAVSGAWDGLDRRCLLSSSADHARYYLHSFIAAWLRTRQLGYAGHGEDNEADFAEVSNEGAKQHSRKLHSAIATCWLEQLGSSSKATNLNIERALEAFHHLVAAGDADRVRDIAVDLVTGNLEWAKQRMRILENHLYQTKAPISKLLQVLEYRAVLEPDNPVVQRFLGECFTKIEGRNSTNALKRFEEACKLSPDYPHNWANLGKTLLAQGEDGARDFLQRIEVVKQTYPQAINDYVCSIQSDCLKKLGDTVQAAVLRMEKIDAGSNDSVFYADEANARLGAGDTDGALEILDKAEQNGATDDYTDAILSRALQNSNPLMATNLRMRKINAGSRNSQFYNDEAKARQDAGDTEGVLEILDKAEQNGTNDDYSDAIRARALQKSDPQTATALRMKKINAGSNDSIFYSDEAIARLGAGDTDGALVILDLADKNGAVGEYTQSIRASVLRRKHQD